MATELTDELIEKTAQILQEWGSEASGEMIKLLLNRVSHGKGNRQANGLAASLVFDGTKVNSSGVQAVWQLNDYWIYIDLGVKGVQNRSKYYKSLDYPSGFQFKNLGVPPQMRSAMQNYIARKGLKVNNKKGQSKLEASHQMAYAMSRAVKKKGIDGTRFYSDVFNDAGFKKLETRLEQALGQAIEIRIVRDIEGK